MTWKIRFVLVIDSERFESLKRSEFDIFTEKIGVYWQDVTSPISYRSSIKNNINKIKAPHKKKKWQKQEYSLHLNQQQNVNKVENWIYGEMNKKTINWLHKDT